MFIIQVLYESDKKPAKDKRVAISVDGLFTGGISHEEWTDSNGKVSIDLGNREYVQGKIYVDGRMKYEGYVDKFRVIYI